MNWFCRFFQARWSAGVTLVIAPFIASFIVLFIAGGFVWGMQATPSAAQTKPPQAKSAKAAKNQAVQTSSVTNISSSVKETAKESLLALTFKATPKSAAAVLLKPQVPVISSKRVVMRFTGATNDFMSFGELHNTFLTGTTTSETNTALTYTFALTQTPDSCTVTDNGAAVTLTIHFHKPEKLAKKNDAPIAKKPAPQASSNLASSKPLKLLKSPPPAIAKADLKTDPKTPAKSDDKNDEKKDLKNDSASEPNAETSETLQPTNRNKWGLDVIVIDPGHGGKDAGAVSTKGVKEKDVVLGIGKKLGALIKKNMAGTSVVYTRSDDTFIELDRRGQIANEAGGKLFVSIHCNSTPKKPSPANGFEVYILRPGKTQEAVRVAEFENSVIRFESNAKRYAKLTDEQFIIVNMAQSAFVKLSDTFASLLVREADKITPLTMRGVNQAGFYVLVGASMPSVLIETAFVSNKKDEQYLKSEKGQQQLAQGMFNAIKAYREFYEKQLQLDAGKK